MTRWGLALGGAALALTMSGWLSSLERTTEQSALLAESSKTAPRTTGAAEQEVSGLPAIADLTGRQAAAFDALADALEVSSQRVADFNDTLGSQIQGLGALRASMAALDDPISCVRGRLATLLSASARTPRALDRITAGLAAIRAAQNKSIRHLRSINRKLTALGPLATASGVEAPPVPDLRPPPQPPRSTSSPRSC